MGTRTRLGSFCVAVLSLLAGLTGLSCGNPGGDGNNNPPNPPPGRAQWTVLVFMNGDNNLEPDSLADFREMARVGSTDKVNLIVQHDRNGNFVPDSAANPRWTQTLRFRITRDMQPHVQNAVQDIGEANMGDPRVLREFVDWGISTYPAERYFLIVWDHGQGYRANMRPLATTRPAVAEAEAAPAGRPAIRTGYRSISSDDTNGGDELFNSELQQALRGAGVHVIGFDACLMAMAETAYAMRDVAQVMVGSEELEPGSGWQYDDWARAVVDNPAMSATELGRLIVQSYERRYGPGSPRQMPDTTLSAVNLGEAGALADAITALADRLRDRLDAELSNIKSARAACRVYAPDPFGDGRDYFFHIDLDRFCEQLAARTADAQLRELAGRVRERIRASVIQNYAGSERQGDFGSKGLAIYFPATRADYRRDPFEKGGYRKDNTNFPVEFVQRHRWADFLHAYFDRVP